ncbi:MAG: biopolymer transporter ExbD [Planctomyces sp.]|nr:biopolymer transporter ExbD [Planctomyces sp.]
MPLRSEAPEEPQLNLTPMIDVVLQLVIFFMVGTQFVDSERKYDINLPLVTDAQPLTERPDEIVINISKTGDVSLGAEPVDEQSLLTRLREAQQRYADQAVVIRGDMECVYQTVVTVLDVCKLANISHIQVATRVENQAIRN